MRGIAFALIASLSPVSPVGAAGTARAHPIHSTLTEIVRDPARGTLRVNIRVFADDFGVALARSGQATAAAVGPTWEAAAARYAASVVGVRDGRSRSLTLHQCGVRRAGAVLWVCLETDVVAPTEHLQVRNSILCELYDDQVNVVQGVFGDGRRSLLFVHGDGYKLLR